MKIGGNSKGMSNICKLKYHYTYQTKNLINGKTYIGRHSTNNLNDGYLGSGKMLKRAIQKYGKENFECIPMCYFDTYEESVEEEKFLVTIEYCKDKNNYNIVEGGTNPIMYGEMNPSTGKKLTEEEKIKRKLSMLHTFTPVIVHDIYYESITSCCKNIHSDTRTIIKRCLSESFKDYKFYHKEDFEKYNKKYPKKEIKPEVKIEKNLTLKIPADPTKIREKTLNTKKEKGLLVKVNVNNTIFDSVAECAISFNINKSTVDSRCVSPHFKDWKYVDLNHQKKREEIYYNKISKRYSIKKSKTAELKKPVIIIEGKNYYSFKEAGKDYNIYWETVQKRGVSENFKEWIFPSKEDFEKYKLKFDRIIVKDRNRNLKKK